MAATFEPVIAKGDAFNPVLVAFDRVVDTDPAVAPAVVEASPASVVAAEPLPVCVPAAEHWPSCPDVESPWCPWSPSPPSQLLAPLSSPPCDNVDVTVVPPWVKTVTGPPPWPWSPLSPPFSKSVVKITVVTEPLESVKWVVNGKLVIPVSWLSGRSPPELSPPWSGEGIANAVAKAVARRMTEERMMRP